MNEQQFYCYILCNSNEKYSNHTYVGFTKCPPRRIRQHNRELTGGAKATQKGAGTWCFMALITNFKTQSNALSCEWKLKHVDSKRRKNKKYSGIDGKIRALNEVLCLGRWTEKCEINNADCQYTVYVIKEVYEKLNHNFPPNINVVCGLPLSIARDPEHSENIVFA